MPTGYLLSTPRLGPRPLAVGTRSGWDPLPAPPGCSSDLDIWENGRLLFAVAVAKYAQVRRGAIGLKLISSAFPLWGYLTTKKQRPPAPSSHYVV